MSRFTRTIDEVIDFDGDRIRLTLRRMLNSHMILLAPMLSSTDQLQESAIGRAAKINEEAKTVLSECVVKFEGLRDADGASISLDEAMHEVYFLPLFEAILAKILRASVLTEDDEKKSVATAPDDSSAAPPSRE